jgi:hypothetical protein
MISPARISEAMSSEQEAYRRQYSGGSWEVLSVEINNRLYDQKCRRRRIQIQFLAVMRGSRIEQENTPVDNSQLLNLNRTDRE